MLNLDGWVEIDCQRSDEIQRAIYEHHEATGEGVILSTLTDPSGSLSGMKVVYTEWGRDGVPELRTYGWQDERGCKHYIREDGAS